MKRAFLVLFVPLCLLGQTGYDIAKMVDERKQPDDMINDMTMTLTSRTGSTRTLTVHSIRKGDEKQILWFLAPADDRGVAFLRIEFDDRDDEMRMWLPSFNKMRRIASSKKGESFMGSDLSYEDMSSRPLDEYTYDLNPEEAIDGQPCWVLISIPKPEINSSYSQIISWIRQSDLVPVREEYYDRAGNLQKERSMEMKAMKEYMIPVRMFVRNVQKEHTTELLFDNVQVDTGVEDELFHERNLRRLP